MSLQVPPAVTTTDHQLGHTTTRTGALNTMNPVFPLGQGFTDNSVRFDVRNAHDKVRIR